MYFQPDVERDEEVASLRESLEGRFQTVAGKCASHRDQFLQHQALWRDRRREALDKFLISGENGTQPSLTQFKQQVSQCQFGKCWIDLSYRNIG